MYEWFKWENIVFFWWVSLCVASFVNITAWFWIRYYKYSGSNFSDLLRFPKEPNSMIWLSFLYVFVCAYRAFLPRADVQRLLLFDTWFSSVFLGRSMASIAELAFTLQWVLLFYSFSNFTKDSLVGGLSKLLFPIIFMAELCSWYGVSTQNYLGNTIEESLWAFCFSLIILGLFKMWLQTKKEVRLGLAFILLCCFLYVFYMLSFDVPMYYNRYLQDLKSSKEYLGILEGLVHLNTSWSVSREPNLWYGEMPWQFMYFTFAVQLSLLLCFFPNDDRYWKKYVKKV